MRGGSRTYLPVQRQRVGGRPPTVAARLDPEPAVTASSFPEVEHQLRAGGPLAAPGLAGLQALQQTSGNQAVQRLISEPASPVAVQRLRGGAAPPSLADRARAGATSVGAQIINAFTGNRSGAERTAANITGHNSDELTPLAAGELAQTHPEFTARAEELNAQNTMARTAQGMAQDHAVSSAAGHAIDATVGGAFGSTAVSTAISAGRNVRQAAALRDARGGTEEVNAALNLASQRQMVQAGANVVAGGASAAMTATGLGLASGVTSAVPALATAAHDYLRRDEINAAASGAAQHLSSTDQNAVADSTRAAGVMLGDARLGATLAGASELGGAMAMRSGITGGAARMNSQMAHAAGIERQVAEQAAALRATEESAELAMHAPPMAMPMALPSAPAMPALAPALPARVPALAPALPARVPALAPPPAARVPARVPATPARLPATPALAPAMPLALPSAPAMPARVPARVPAVSTPASVPAPPVATPASMPAPPVATPASAPPAPDFWNIPDPIQGPSPAERQAQQAERELDQFDPLMAPPARPAPVAATPAAAATPARRAPRPLELL